MITRDSLVFFALADWGKGTYSDSDQDGELNDDSEEGEVGDRENCPDGNELCQLQTAQSMISVASDLGKPSFILALGDNFYDDGVYSTDDPMFEYQFRSIYLQESNVLSGIPWHAAIGNHDLGYGKTGVDALVNRTTHHSDDDEWVMPSQWYSRRYASPYNFVSVEIVVVDTTWLAPSETEATSQVSEEVQSWRLEEQLKGLEAIFEKSEKLGVPTYRIVAGHYPMFSNGEKGDNAELVESLLPLLEKYKVSAFLAGHDHNAQHLQYGHQNFIVTGHSTLTNSDIEDGQVSAASPIWTNAGDAGFTRFEASTSQLKVQFIQSNDSSVAYEYSFAPLRPTRLQMVTKHAAEIVLATAALAFLATIVTQLYFYRIRKMAYTRSNFISVVYTSPKMFNSERHPMSLDDEELEF